MGPSQEDSSLAPGGAESSHGAGSVPSTVDSWLLGQCRVGLLLIPASPTGPSALCSEAAGKGEEQGRAEEIPELAAAAGGGRFL